ncbi:hypothetical protein [Streptomyces luteireticuli]|uniref:hypothetical protein n=1 Tax=Streptomyces luteireticuli TaxID=173858 RepID=UPI003557101A
MPTKVSLLLETKGMDSTLADLLAVSAEFDRLKGARTIRVDSLTEKAQKDLKSLGFTVETLPGTRQIRITAPTRGAQSALQRLIEQLGAVPSGKNVKVSAQTQATIASLQEVQAELQSTPGAKTVHVSAPTEAARSALEQLGFTISAVPGSKDVTVTVPTGGPTAAVSTIQSAINSLYGKDITVGVHYSYDGLNSDGSAHIAGMGHWVDGGVVDYYAQGGIRNASGTPREDHVAQIAPAGDIRVWAERESGGESYIPLAPSKRARSKLIAEETVRRLGGRRIEWFADGGLSNWSYSPPTLYTLSGLAGEAKDSKGNFDLDQFMKKLRAASRASIQWHKDLTTVARRAGQDVADALADMGEDGIKLTRRMASGSTKYVRSMSRELEKLAASARATLGDFTSQLTKATRNQSTFERNLTRLAAMGYGDLAAMLAAQGGKDAEALAAEAVKNKKKAQQANDAAKASKKTLPGDALTDLLTIIAAIKDTAAGIHKVSEKTGLEEDRIIEVAGLGRSRITGLGRTADPFLADLSRAQRGLSYENGGIWKPGIYPPTRGGLIRFAEPSTQGEAFIPLASARRARATSVLADVATRFGLQVAPAGSAMPVRTVAARPDGPVKVVVIREPSPLIGTMPVTVTDSSATPEQIGAEVMRRLRNARRGGRP